MAQKIEVAVGDRVRLKKFVGPYMKSEHRNGIVLAIYSNGNIKIQRDGISRPESWWHYLLEKIKPASEESRPRPCIPPAPRCPRLTIW